MGTSGTSRCNIQMPIRAKGGFLRFALFSVKLSLRRGSLKPNDVGTILWGLT